MFAATSGDNVARVWRIGGNEPDQPPALPGPPDPPAGMQPPAAIVRVAGDDGLPLAGVEVTAESGVASVTAVTTDDGIVAFPELASGEYEFRFELAGFNTVFRSETIAADSVRSFTVSMSPGFDVDEPTEETITVRGREEGPYWPSGAIYPDVFSGHEALIRHAALSPDALSVAVA